MKQWILRVRKVAAWTTLVAAVNSFVVFSMLRSEYPWLGTSVQQFAPQPSIWLIWWQRASLILLVALIVISLPRWQSFIGIGVIVFMFWVASSV